CTRWFLPLVILPLPTAPPYFLAVFLVSLFLHARPCFYCMMLLTALFTSSCYWQAVPVESALTYPIGDATTFGEALRANLSIPSLDANSNLTSNTDNLSTDAIGSWNVNLDLPPVVQLIDRCWCNVFSRSGLFHPGDVAAWERESVDQARKAIESQ
ncbi:uncharacterized protein FOMMEDRAFT_36571, partial [Fomitiporia mediterranea MF3/22]|uniref:uncharacterized protein n=1 Tax=Fomitiporia mediterranea (strain MF3/22) TaxID=694068 RepID=UPI000440940F